MPETNDTNANPFDFFKTEGYDNEFCLCFKDPLVCIATWFCPCLVVGKVKGELDGRQFDVLVNELTYNPSVYIYTIR